MFIQKIYKKVKDKTYRSVLLIENYREDGKVKHKTISNITQWSDALIEQFDNLLKNKSITNLSDLNYKQGKNCGGILISLEVAKRLGIIKALGSDKNSKLALIQILGRIFTQGSRLYLANEWHKNNAINEILKIENYNEDDLYYNLDWLSENQTEIEKKIFQTRYKGQSISSIYLYDVTSSYFEGTENELSDYGYNRDGKKGKKQIVIGLLCDKLGYPVSIEVFEGNTSDSKTVINQLKKIKEIFGIKQVVFVGDKGMIKQQQIDSILSEEFQWNYITTITKPKIESLIKNEVIQLSMFDEKLVEIIDNNTRYILRRNPCRVAEMENTRQSKINKIEQKIKQKNQYLSEHKKAKIETAKLEIEKLISKLKASKYTECQIIDNKLHLEIFQSEIDQQSKLDGCYVIKTDLVDKSITKEEIHNRYKDLALVEDAFRNIKTTIEEIQPIFVRKEKRTRGHVFVCMLALLIIKYILINVKSKNMTKKFILESINQIQYIEYKFIDESVKLLPTKFCEHQNEILTKLNITLPKYL